MLIEIDPLKRHSHLPDDDIIELCGFIPDWVMDYAHTEMTTGLMPHLEKCYGYPTLPSTEGTVDANGVHRYPGDPPQYPMLKIQLENETFYQYPSAFIAVVSPSGTHVTRMD